MSHRAAIPFTKVIHVVPTLGAGGTEQNALSLMGALSKIDNFENHVVALRAGDESFRRRFEETEPFEIVILPSERIKRVREFNRRVRWVRPAAVVFHFFNIEQALLAVSAKCAGSAALAAAAGTAAVSLGRERWKWRVALAVNRAISCPIISASNWIERTLMGLAPLPRDSCVVRNGLDVERFASARMIAARKKPADRWTIGMVGRLDEAKDHRTLILGFARFVAANPDIDAELRIIGDGPLRQELEALVAKVNLSGRIAFCGTRTDIPQQLCYLDLFAFSTTTREGFGNVLVEALAAGIPIIANDVPSSNEVLCGGKFGTLIPNNGPDAWAEAFARHWYQRQPIALPSLGEIELAYGAAQFAEGYKAILQLESAGNRSP